MTETTSSWTKKLDIFAFSPVPYGDDYSSKRSRYATFAFILIFVLYLGYTLYVFFAQNVPRVNQFYNQLDASIQYPAPTMAFAFVTGDNLNASFYNPTYFTFSFQQVTVNSNPNIPRNYTTIPMSPCRPSWLAPNFDVYCPAQETVMQGLLYGSAVNMYPRMKVTLCNNATTNNSCADINNITNTLMTGRLFVFLKPYDTFDYQTGKNVTDNTPYTSYYYFILMNQYNRAEVKVQAEQVTINPNLFTTWTDQQLQRLTLAQQNFYVSEVPVVNSHDLFLWWCSMQDSSLVTTVGYQTSLNLVSDAAAMWGLLIAVFALYFLRFNQNSYYNERPQMTNFDERITPHVKSLETSSPMDLKSKRSLIVG